MYYTENMKTDTSITEKRYNQAAKEVTIDLVAVYLKRWTQKELKQYIKQPVVIPINNYGFLIGHYKIQQVAGDIWRVSYHDGEIVKDFNNRLASIYYCLCDIKKYYNMSRDISNYDTMLGRVQSNIAHAQTSLTRAHKKKNYFKVDVLNNTIIEYQLQFEVAKSLLEKSLKLAKYYKIWDKPS